MKIFTQMTYCNFVLRISTLVILSWGNAFASTLENAPPHVDAVSERLTEWIHNGICGKSAECSRTNKKLYIACVTPTCEERGVYSSDPKGVTVNETMLRIPVEYVLTADHVLLERRYPGIHKKLPSLEPANSKLNVICMLLAAEIWLRGSDSDLAPWLAALPKRMHTPVWWETVEIQEFLMPDERDSVLRLKSEPREIYRHHFKTSWPKVVQYFVDHFPSVAKSLTQWPARRDSLPFQQFLRVYSIVESRAWSLKGQRYLVPGADMFNHNYTETDRIEPPANFMRLPRSQNFVNTHLIHSDWLEIRADQPALVDTQLFESYGDSSTETYFQFFGFVPERNPYDCVPIQSGECLYWGQIWSMSDLRIRQNLQEMILRVRNFVHRLQFLPDGENADFELRKELSIKFYRQKLLLYENVRDSYRQKISEHREL